MRSSPLSVASIAATIVGLCGFAVAQPLLAVLGDGATFFAAHGATGGDLVAFTLVVVLLPPIVVAGVLLIAYGLAPTVFHQVVAVVVGLLVAAVVVPAFDRAMGLSTPLYVGLVIVVAAIGSVAFARVPLVRAYTGATAFAPLLFGGLFLFASPASAILSDGDAGGGRSSLDTDVVLLLFDEMALAPLLDADGAIDPVRYPNFARLAATSTWYANTSTVSPWTQWAVPSLMTGNLPDDEAIPVASDYPRNLISMLAATHDVRAMETITYLCEGDGCGTSRVRSRRQMLRDASTVYLHSLLPDGLAGRWLPETGDRWAGFGGGSPDAEFADRADWEEDALVEAGLDQGPRVQELLGRLPATTDGPTFLFGHMLLPHLPSQYLPDGRPYQVRTRTPGIEPDGLTWSDSASIIDVNRQRYVLQMQYVDTIVGQVLDHLEASGRADDTMLIVTSDHGIRFAPGETRRGVPLTDQNRAEILPVPLFIKYPGQTTAIVDREPRQTIDIVPTIVETLEVDLPEDWAFDGVPLTDPEPRSHRDYVGESETDLPLDLDVRSAADTYLRWFGEGRATHDVYAWGPHAELVGRRTDDLETAVGAPTVSGQRVSPAVVYDPNGPIVPVLVEYELASDANIEWLAVSLNGVIAGVAPVHESDETVRALVIVDPSLLVVGENVVAAWTVDEAGVVRQID